MNSLDTALDLAANHGWPVFPCKTDKTPATPHGFKDATTDLKRIDAWFQNGALLGVPTGLRTRLLVVDIDPAAADWYHANAARLACKRIHKTRRGWHLLYRTEQTFQCSAGKLAPGVDVRSDGGYIIWWPSVGLEATGDIEDISPPPQWLVDALTRTSEKPKNEAPSGDGRIREGRRNSALASIAGAMRRKGASPAAIEAALLAENAARCVPPLDEQEVCKIAASVGGYAPSEEMRPETRRFNRQAARVGMATFDRPPAPPELIVQGYMPRTVGAKVGAGGFGKSTLDLFEAVHIALGRPLYGLEVMRPGPVLILTAEDPRDVALWRLYRLAEDMRLSRPEREHIAEHVHIEDASGYPCRFVDVDQGGRLVRTVVLEELAEEYGAAGLSAVFADPQNAFGPGERFVNDGEAELMRGGAWLSARLNCAVRFVHHVGKGNARAGMVDQYAGRGGSAGADNARFVHILAPHLADGEGYTAPRRCSAEDMAEGRLLRLHVAKLSHGKRPAAPFWLLRSGFTFEHLRPDADDPETVERERLRALWTFLGAEGQRHVRHTRRSLEDRRSALGLSRDDLRALLHVALERRHVVELELATSERRGQRKSYLAQGSRP